MADLVSYDSKHNEANGEGNRDGTDDNRSWNCGVEGPTDDPQINALRARQRRNLLATLLLSEGVPLLLGGDELGRTQDGNNNAYCQDNELSWTDWSLAGTDTDLSAFVSTLARLRRVSPALARGRFAGAGEIVWFAPDGHFMEPADWLEPYAHAVGLAAADGAGRLLINAWWEPLQFTLPELMRASLPAAADRYDRRRRQRTAAADLGAGDGRPALVGRTRPPHMSVGGARTSVRRSST